MALRKTITEIEAGDVEATVHLDTGMSIDQQCWITAEGEGWEVRRVFWFGSYNEYYAENFVEKLARNEDYRWRCVNRETGWARIGDAVSEGESDLSELFRSHYSELGEEYKTLTEEMHEAVIEAFDGEEPTGEELDEIREQFLGRAEEIIEEHKQVPSGLGIDDEMPFGKHEGKPLRQIAEDDPGYLEWGVEELDNRPEVQRGFEKALDLIS
jgi:hypothetical protein